MTAFPNIDAIERFEQAVRANGYRTCDAATDTEYQAAKAALLAEARKAEALEQALKTPFCVLFLDGRNEHGTHVLPSFPTSIDVVEDDLAEQAEAILEAAENAGFQIGQHVWAEFAWIAPQIGDEGRVELDGYWDFRWINEPMSTLLQGEKP